MFARDIVTSEVAITLGKLLFSPEAKALVKERIQEVMRDDVQRSSYEAPADMNTDDRRRTRAAMEQQAAMTPTPVGLPPVFGPSPPAHAIHNRLVDHIGPYDVDFSGVLIRSAMPLPASQKAAAAFGVTTTALAIMLYESSNACRSYDAIACDFGLKNMS